MFASVCLDREEKYGDPTPNQSEIKSYKNSYHSVIPSSRQDLETVGKPRQLRIITSELLQAKNQNITSIALPLSRKKWPKWRDQETRQRANLHQHGRSAH